MFSFFKKDSSGSNRTPHTPARFGPLLFVFLLTARLSSPVLAVRPFLPGLPVWTHRDFRILSVLGGLSSLAPSEALFSDARWQGRFLSFLLCLFVFPFLWFLRLHTFSGCPSRSSDRSGLSLEDHLFWVLLFAFLVFTSGHRGPQDQFSGGVPLAPSLPFFTRVFCLLAQIFSWALAPGSDLESWMQTREKENERIAVTPSPPPTSPCISDFVSGEGGNAVFFSGSPEAWSAKNLSFLSASSKPTRICTAPFDPTQTGLCKLGWVWSSLILETPWA